jgi:hypothetical protein
VSAQSGIAVDLYDAAEQNVHEATCDQQVLIFVASMLGNKTSHIKAEGRGARS